METTTQRSKNTARDALGTEGAPGLQDLTADDATLRKGVNTMEEDQQPRSPRTPLRRGGSNSSLADREGFRARLASITYSLSEVDLLDDDGTEINDSDVFGAVTNGDGTFDLHGDGADDTERAAQMEDKEIEDFYMKLTYYIASEPSGDLNTQDAIDLLNFFTLLQPEDHEQYLSIGAVQAVFNVMERGATIPQIQVLACYAVRALAATQHGEDMLLQNGVLGELMVSSEGFPDVAELQTIVLVLFAELACSEQGRTAMFESHCHRNILSVMASLTPADADARRWACAAIAFLAENYPAGQDILIRAGAMAALVGCITPSDSAPEKRTVGDHGDNPTTNETTEGGDNEGEESEGEENDGEENDGEENAVGDNADGDVAQLALLGLKNLLAHPSGRAKLLDGNTTGLLPTTDLTAVRRCMRAHLPVAGVQEHGCAIMQQLLAVQDGADTEEHSMVCTALRNSGYVDLLHDIAATHADALALQSTVEGLFMQLSSGYTGYAYHFVKATLANFSLWRHGLSHGSKNTQAPDVA